MKKTLILAVLLAPAAAFGQEFHELKALDGYTGTPAAPPDAGQPEYDFGLDPSAIDTAGGFLGVLRAEALADPEKFIDEHSPAEVGFAFGLDPSRFRITDPGRIENAAVKITVDLSAQRARVKGPDFDRTFVISSGLPPKATPGSGRCYAPDLLKEMHYSSLYNNAPMPNTIFFNGNIAMHATGAEHLLGQPASKGCIRLSKTDAKTVYNLVKANGKANAAICITGATPKL